MSANVNSAIGKMQHVAASLRAGDAWVLKSVTLAFVFGTAFICVYRSIAHPRGVIRRFAAGYVARIDAAQKSMFRNPSGAKMGWTQLGVIFVALVVYGVVPSAVMLVLALFAAVAPPLSIWSDVKKRRARIDDQAHGFCLSLANALKATASIGDAMRGATDVTAAPLKQELQTVMRQVGVGSTMEEALLALSVRVQSPAVDVVVSALLIGRQTGGDLPRILEGTAASLRELKRLEGYTNKVTRSSKQSLFVSASVTAGLAAYLPRMFPGFLEPLKETVKGQVYAAQMVFVFVLALYLGYRFTRKSI